MPRRSLFPLYDRLLGGQLESLLLGMRREELTFTQIADRLASMGVDVTPETARRWVREAEADLDAAS